MYLGIGEALSIYDWADESSALPGTAGPKGSEGNAGGTDVTKCDSNVWYPEGSPCDLVQDGVDIGQALILARQKREREAAAKGKAPATAPAKQWVKGVDNILVIALGGLAVVMIMKSR